MKWFLMDKDIELRDGPLVSGKALVTMLRMEGGGEIIGTQYLNSAVNL